MSNTIADIAWPMCASSYTVTPQTYMRTTLGSTVSSGSLRRESEL